MTKEELLKPRYKVIADYPHSEWKVGKICARIKGATNDIFHINEYAVVGGISLNEIKKYPHIFKPLEWYEDRDEKDMPEYLKFIDSKIVISVFKYKNGLALHAGGGSVLLHYLTPAIKEEYNNQQSKIKNHE